MEAKVGVLRLLLSEQGFLHSMSISVVVFGAGKLRN